MLSRRQFLAAASASAAWLTTQQRLFAEEPKTPELRYIVGSSMYGYASLADILKEVPQTGAAALDVWPKVHGNQREQIDELGLTRVAGMCKAAGVTIECITQYKLGPFGLQDEVKVAQQLGCGMIVAGGKGPRGLKGTELRSAVKTFAEQLKPHLDHATSFGVTLAVENHGNNLIESPDSMRWLAEFTSEDQLGIALAPYHLPQEPEQLAKIIRDLGNRIRMFYAWQHGMGSKTKLPKEQELLQMPGRGELDFGPLLQALYDVDYDGWTEIFMHPVPRGVPILEPIGAVTEEINRSRAYLQRKWAEVVKPGADS